MSEAALQKQRDRIQLDRDQRALDLRSVMETPAGKRFIWGVIDVDCGTFGGSFVAGHPDVSNFNEGRRSIGSELLQEIQAAAPDQYAVMVAQRAREAANRAREMAAPVGVPNKRDPS